MRFSLWKVLKLTIFIALVIVFNVLLIIYRDGENYIHRRAFGDSFEAYGSKYGVNKAKPVDTNMGAQPNSVRDFRRGQRSAKSTPNDRIGFVGAKIARRNGLSLLATKNIKTHNKYRKETTLTDVFISVKTTKKFHQSRVMLQLKTWFMLARDVTYFFTDSDDPELNKLLGGHLINTNCSSFHNRQALCCKMAIEFDTFLESNKRWFCHVDDDTYVNVPQLLQLLQEYNHQEDWYLGKPSLQYPIEIMDRDKPGQKLAFWFATGGAGICISRSLALKMMPYASGGRLMTMGDKIRLPDDCTIGYIIDHILKKRLTVIDGFHSHLEPLWLIQPNSLQKQITFSYSRYGKKMNRVNVPGFTELEDPSRLKSVHCYLFPSIKECKKLNLRIWK